MEIMFSEFYHPKRSRITYQGKEYVVVDYEITFDGFWLSIQRVFEGDPAEAFEQFSEELV